MTGNPYAQVFGATRGGLPGFDFDSLSWGHSPNIRFNRMSFRVFAKPGTDRLESASVSVLYTANKYRQNDFTIKPSELSALSRVKKKTLKKALASLEAKGLIWVWAEKQSLVIEICDPYTGEPFDTAKYSQVVQERSGRKLHRNWTPSERERIVRASLSSDWPITKHGDELEIRCIFHEPDNTPSLRLNLVKGCYHCFSCEAKGHFTQFVGEAKNLNRVGALQFQAAALGKETEVRDSDINVEARHPYRNAGGKVLYYKDRMKKKTDDRDEKKRILMWRPTEGEGRIYNITGIKRVLYNLPELKNASVVILTESEKDCDRLNASPAFIRLFLWNRSSNHIRRCGNMGGSLRGRTVAKAGDHPATRRWRRLQIRRRSKRIVERP
jgi:CHC2 zinc finger